MNKLNLNTSIFAAICAAILFGVSTPFAKQLTGTISPLMLAGLLYLGSGLGLVLFRLIKDLKWKSSGLLYREWIWVNRGNYLWWYLRPYSIDAWFISN